MSEIKEEGQRLWIKSHVGRKVRALIFEVAEDPIDGYTEYIPADLLIAAETRGQAVGLERAAKACEVNYKPTNERLESYQGGLNEAARRYAREIRALSPDPDYAKRLVITERERITPIIKTLVQDFARQDRVWQLDLADILAAIDKEDE